MGLENLIYGGSGLFGGMLTVMLGFFFIMVLTMVIPVAIYVLHSLGLYTIAARRGLRHKWLAWLPFGNMWLLGSISDQYQYLVKGRIRYCRRWLLLLCIMIVAIYYGCVLTIMGSMLSLDYLAAIINRTFGSWLALIAMLLVYSVLRVIAYYDLFRSCQPSNAVLYLVLGILIPVTLPFFVFAIRKKDLGMPPRKKRIVEEIVEEEFAEEPSEETEEATEETTEETPEETPEEPVEEIPEETEE